MEDNSLARTLKQRAKFRFGFAQGTLRAFCARCCQ
jgi:hypothetical protein